MQLFSKKINFPPFSPIFLAKISTLGVRDALFTQGIRTKQMMLPRYYIMFTLIPFIYIDILIIYIDILLHKK